MTADTKKAFKDFVDKVAESIARQSCSKDVDWQAVIQAGEELSEAIDNEPLTYD